MTRTRWEHYARVDRDKADGAVLTSSGGVGGYVLLGCVRRRWSWLEDGTRQPWRAWARIGGVVDADFDALYWRRCDAKRAVEMAASGCIAVPLTRVAWPWHEDHYRCAWKNDPYAPGRYSDNPAVLRDMQRGARVALRRARHRFDRAAVRAAMRAMGLTRYDVRALRGEPRIRVRNAEQRRWARGELPF